MADSGDRTGRRTALDSDPIGIPGVGSYEWDAAEDRLHWSAELMAIYGVDRAPESEREFTELVHPADRTRVEAETSAFIGSGDSYDHEFRIVRPDGRVRTVHDRGVIERAGDGTVLRMRGVNVDVSSRRGLESPAEEEVRQSEERLRLASEAAGFGVYEVDLQSNRSYWSAALRRIVGRPGGDGAGSVGKALSHVHPEDRERVRTEMLEATRRIGRYHLEYRIQWPDGTVRWVADRGETFGPIDISTGRARYSTGTLLDITDRILAQMALRESEARLQLAHDAAEIGAWDVDLRTSRSVWSPKLYELLDVTPGEPVSDQLFFVHVHPEDIARVRESYVAAIAERTTFDQTFRIVRRDGTVRHLAGKGRVVEEDGDTPVRMIGVNYDVTESKRAEERGALVMREAKHRLKNAMSLVQAVARQTAQTSPEDFLNRFEQRIAALGAAQDLLLGNEWKGAGIREVFASQLAHFEDLIGNRIRMTGPDVELKPEAAHTLGMAVHELATNAGKYGALSNGEGSVEVEWRLDGKNGAARTLSIEWVETGGPPVVPPIRTGFGRTVVEKVAKAELDASVELDYAPTGLIWRLECADAALIIRSRP